MSGSYSAVSASARRTSRWTRSVTRTPPNWGANRDEYAPTRRQDGRKRPGAARGRGVPEAACAGHFENYPALPVALLVGQLGEIVASLIPSGWLRSTQVSVNATHFCWAGERVRFEAQRAPVQGAAEAFDCQVVAEGRRVCSAEFTVVAF